MKTKNTHSNIFFLKKKYLVIRLLSSLGKIINKAKLKNIRKKIANNV